MTHQNIQKLIKRNNRRLQKLKEQQASFGLHTPAHILTEIEDTEAELEKLHLDLMELDVSEEAVLQANPDISGHITKEALITNVSPPPGPETDLKYYFYISESKIDMLWPQIPPKILKSIATQLNIDPKSPSPLTKVKIVTDYILNNLEVGTVAEPNAYFRGTLPMTTGFIPVPASPGSSYLYFGGKINFEDTAFYRRRQLTGDIDEHAASKKRAVALVGSPKHLWGHPHSHPSLSDFNPYLSSRIIASFSKFVLDDSISDKSLKPEFVARAIYAINNDMGGKMTTTKYQLFEFLAKRLYEDADAVIGTPIYVELAD